MMRARRSRHVFGVAPRGAPQRAALADGQHEHGREDSCSKHGRLATTTGKRKATTAERAPADLPGISGDPPPGERLAAKSSGVTAEKSAPSQPNSGSCGIRRSG